ncbi:MAG: hypothetical protein ACTS3F_11240 [Phycisphaerales bacterium]
MKGVEGWTGGLFGSVIGVDLGSRVLKACQWSRGGWRVASVWRESDGEIGSDEIRGLARVLARRGFSGTRVVASVPRSALLSCRASAPMEGSGAPVEQIARAELARVSGQNAGALLSASWSARSRRSRSELDERQVLGCSAAVARGLSEAFGGGGLDLVGLEPGPVGSARGALHIAGLSGAGSAGSSGLIVDFGWGGARLLAVSDGVLMYERCMDEHGQRRFTEELCGLMGLDPEMAVALSGAMSSNGDAEWCARLAKASEVLAREWGEGLCAEIERGLNFAGERYGIEAGSGVLLCGGGVDGAVGRCVLELMGDGVRACAGVVPGSHGLAMGLCLGKEGVHAVRRSAS